MSITTVIDEENITIVQGINGILLYKEEWMKKKKARIDSYIIIKLSARLCSQHQK